MKATVLFMLCVMCKAVSGQDLCFESSSGVWDPYRSLTLGVICRNPLKMVDCTVCLSPISVSYLLLPTSISCLHMDSDGQTRSVWLTQEEFIQSPVNWMMT